ncbi:MAG: hypothetical protein NVS3B15_06480 [Sediminibacterium sp.]
MNKPAANFPLVSVVMATYNGERYIGEQLDSILQQTYPNLEVVIVDDGSTDGSAALLQAYAQKYPNIKLYVNETNLGYVRNFEKGLLLATGDFISPSDHDDIWDSNKTSILMEKMGDNAIVFCDSELVDRDGHKMGRKLSDIKRFACFDDCLNFTIGNSAPGHAMIIRKETVLAAVPLPAMIPHDYWLSFVATFHSRLVYTDQVLVQYRQHGGNVFGAVKVKTESDEKRKRKKLTNQQKISLARERMKLIYEKCPAELKEQKKIFHDLSRSYESFSLINNFRRMFIFFRYNKRMLAFKQRSVFRRWLFCLKMFVKIQ